MPTPLPTTPTTPTTQRLTLLKLALVGTLLFGAALMALPQLTHQGFSLLMFNDAQRIQSFGAEAQAYITLVHGVLGAVMVGWALALLGVVVWLWALAPALAWRVVTLSVAGWFVVDTSFSLSVGAWQNALLNLAFAALYAVGLTLARPRPHQTKVA